MSQPTNLFRLKKGRTYKCQIIPFFLFFLFIGSFKNTSSPVKFFCWKQKGAQKPQINILPRNPHVELKTLINAYCLETYKTFHWHHPKWEQSDTCSSPLGLQMPQASIFLQHPWQEEKVNSLNLEERLLTTCFKLQHRKRAHKEYQNRAPYIPLVTWTLLVCSSSSCCAQEVTGELMVNTAVIAFKAAHTTEACSSRSKHTPPFCEIQTAYDDE